MCVQDICVGAGRAAPLPVLVTDQCAEGCTTNSVNIHVFGFELLAPLRFGRVPIKYR